MQQHDRFLDKCLKECMLLWPQILKVRALPQASSSHEFFLFLKLLELVVICDDNNECSLVVFFLWFWSVVSSLKFLLCPESYHVLFVLYLRKLRPWRQHVNSMQRRRNGWYHQWIFQIIKACLIRNFKQTEMTQEGSRRRGKDSSSNQFAVGKQKMKVTSNQH